jgi:hypothetical protein
MCWKKPLFIFAPAKGPFRPPPTPPLSRSNNTHFPSNIVCASSAFDHTQIVATVEHFEASAAKTKFVKFTTLMVKRVRTKPSKMFKCSRREFKNVGFFLRFL